MSQNIIKERVFVMKVGRVLIMYKLDF